MVNYGPSRGCISCRRQRKKCDGARPSCQRCLNAKRTCRGYEEGPSYHHRMHDPHPSSSMTSKALKCSLPRRVPLPGTDILPEDKLPAEISEAESDSLALRAFFYDYCIIPINPDLSRGFLSDVEMMAQRLGPNSNLVRACQAVSYVGHGKPLNRPYLVNKAKTMYQRLLRSFARAIENLDSANPRELKLVAMLLGIYELQMAGETDHGHHNTHAGGLAALMRIGHSPRSLLSAGQPGHKIGQRKNSLGHGVFFMPALSDQDEHLDGLLISLDKIWERFEAAGDSAGLHMLMAESVSLNHRFATWEDSRVAELKPFKIGHIKQDNKLELAVGYWPGNVDTYVDLYIAGVWNVFRAARLLLISLIIKLAGALGLDNSYADCAPTATRIAEDLAASVPYHLVDSLPSFLNNLETSAEITDPGKSLGGLLLMHPLYIASRTPHLTAEMREYMQRCLLWIGSNMGLAHATLLAKVSAVIYSYS
ncbi:hypothetical protein BX600DRAFT_457059 [Xylariales sp. PMI_506]|nr:hypothetical protein BX600DRAFT_457059 [Xylariales sp. PMI_506]